MTKKLTALFLALVLCLSLCTVTAFAVIIVGSGTSTDPWKIGKTAGTDNVTAYLDGTTLRIGGTGAMMDCGDNGSNQPWNTYRATITDVVIETGVKSIGKNAFDGCTSLARVTIPASMTNIENYAFRNTGLTSVTILAGVTYGSRVYEGCASLTDVTIQPGVTSISGNMFDHCTALTDVTIQSGVTSISNNMFYFCTALTDITIPDSVTSIGSGAFAASGLESITIPASVTDIGNSAFDGCSSLAKVMVMKATTPLTKLGTNVFKNCDALQKIYVPAGTKTAYRTADNWKSYYDKIFPVYDLTIASMEHGTVTATPTDVASGTDVTLTVTPAEGYRLKSLTANPDAPTIKTIADVLATAEGGFPTLPEKAWPGSIPLNCCYIAGNSLKIGELKAITLLLTADVDGGGDSFTCSDNNVIYTFNMTEGKLTSIKVEGSEFFDDTYAPPPGTPSPSLKPITLTKQTDGTYTFIMPGYAVTVTAVFERTGGGNHHHGGGTATVQSAKTADMGVALYGVLTVSSLLGMGWVSKKKH